MVVVITKASVRGADVQPAREAAGCKPAPRCKRTWVGRRLRQSAGGSECAPRAAAGGATAAASWPPFPASAGQRRKAALHALIAAPRSGALPYPVTIAHLNHRLRGAESDADEAFTADLHARLCVRRRPGARHSRRGASTRGGAERAPRAPTWRRRPRRACRYRWLAGGRARRSGRCRSPPATRPTTRPRRCCIACCAARACKGCAASPPSANWNPESALVRPAAAADYAERNRRLSCGGWTSRLPRGSPPIAIPLTRETASVRRAAAAPGLALPTRPSPPVLARLAEQADEAYRDEEAARHCRAC